MRNLTRYAAVIAVCLGLCAGLASCGSGGTEEGFVTVPESTESAPAEKKEDSSSEKLAETTAAQTEAAETETSAAATEAETTAETTAAVTEAPAETTAAEETQAETQPAETEPAQEGSGDPVDEAYRTAAQTKAQFLMTTAGASLLTHDIMGDPIPDGTYTKGDGSVLANELDASAGDDGYTIVISGGNAVSVTITTTGESGIIEETVYAE